jgi:NTP pyrophosphatase (non-canonical NTP hydrolase)
MEIKDFQKLMRDLYFHNDSQRGIYRTALWLVEEIGELVREVKQNPENIDKSKVEEEMADVYAWVASLANLMDVDLTVALQKKYPQVCLKCGKNPCRCEKNLPSRF